MSRQNEHNRKTLTNIAIKKDIVQQLREICTENNMSYNELLENLLAKWERFEHDC